MFTVNKILNVVITKLKAFALWYSAQ